MAETAVQCCNGNAVTKSAPERTFTPRVDIVENETAVLLYVDMPGVRPADVDLRFEQGELTLKGKVQPREANGQMLFGEFEVGDFQRVFQIPDTIDAGKIDAEFKNGVLIVTLPKQEAAKPKQVPIKVHA
jgi:HSP20 family protein